MRGYSGLILAASIVGSEAIHLQKRNDGSPRVVQHEIQRKDITINPVLRDRLRKRQTKTLTQQLDNEATLYFANVTMGTPEQPLRLHLDTGSSDLWVNVAESAFCSDGQDLCSIGGTYSPNASSTYEYVNGDFNISYVDGSGSSGDYATDVLNIGGSSLESQQFGIGYTSSSQEGIMGIGYPVNEAVTEAADIYVNVPQHMAQAGLISSNAYSLWLNDLDASTGSILFGGVNTEKFTGSLETLPIIPSRGTYAEFIIALTAVGYGGEQGSIASGLTTAVLLDSGSSLMYLPDDIAEAIFKKTGAHYDASQGAAFVDCDLANQDKSIEFTFSSPTISVAMNELVIVAGYQGRNPVCILGIAPAGRSTPVLGDTFLRSAYVVYDLHNNEISLAQTSFNSTSDNIMEITNSSVPDATGVASAVTAVPVETGGGRIKGVPTVTSSGAAGAVMTAAPILGAGVMAAIGMLAL